jgi:hypothetical protein
MPSNQKPVKYCGRGPAELDRLIKKRIEEEHYRSLSDYIIGLIIYDIYCRREHKITSRLMAEPSWVRDKAIEQIIEDFEDERKEGKKRPGGWLDRRIHELVEGAHRDGKQVADSPPP